MIINWNDPIRYTRTKAGKPYSEWRFMATCPCGTQKLLKRCDARKSEQNESPCALCSQREKAAKGYAATRKKYGTAHAVQIMQQYRREHPSSLEVQMAALLDAEQLPYQREVILCERWLVDFVVDHRFVIEVDGEFAHRMRDARKQAMRRADIERAGYPVLTIPEASLPEARFLIVHFMETQHVGTNEIYAYA